MKTALLILALWTIVAVLAGMFFGPSLGGVDHNPEDSQDDN